jgi:hypothetical protein
MPRAQEMNANTFGRRRAAISQRLRRWVGLNVEGVAWDPQNRRLLVWLRSPVVNGHALVVPLKLRDQNAALNFDNLEVEGSKAIRLPLSGAGIRSIEYDESRKAFFLITGAGPNSERMDFKT